MFNIKCNVFFVADFEISRGIVAATYAGYGDMNHIFKMYFYRTLFLFKVLML